ncbi:hypothetical protein HB364_19975 [Pseudoflavitalea sp. X16]|uniref:hypothetical protein n=1 Tax=Paraflavitalea devenefica TaxID=2716334 RepID=UPI001420DFF8|nr:hypothetical protein [Paraflavitalea devenefica]NII27378.1 hypothetical protein [Paraflavitalea devenefica]
MARKRTAVNENALQLLKRLIKIKLNLDCSTSSHIQQLQHDVQLVTGESLSAQTLNRFFGIIRTGFNPSVHTLDTLARYVGYKSFSEFETLNAGKKAEQINATFSSKFIVDVFSQIDTEDKIEPGILQVIKNIATLMADDRQLAADVYCAMAPSVFGRKFFFEQFVNIDALDSVYGDGLQYYLLNAHNREQKFFAYVLYCYRYFLTANATLFQKYFNLLNVFRQSEIMNFHPLLVDRYYAVLVFNQIMQKKEINSLDSMNELADFDIWSSHAKSCYCAGYLVGEALLLAGEFGRSWEVLNSDEIKPSFLTGCLRDEFVTHLNILKLMSGFFSNHISTKRALSLYAELNDKPLPVLLHDYLSFYLLFLKRSLFPKAIVRKEVNEQVQYLVKKTGFVYFREFDLQLTKSESISL